MNIAKIKKNINNLKKIKDIIEISKIDMINKLQQTNKITNTFIQMANFSKNLIEFAHDAYWVNVPLLKKSKSEKTIWIFATISSSLLSVPYTTQEKLILSKFNRKKDELIVIGGPAIKFALKNNITPLYLEEDVAESVDKIPTMIATLANDEQVPKIIFVSINSFSENNEITILPISGLNIKVPSLEINKKYKFFPSISESLDSLGTIYCQRITEALLRDVRYFYLKEKLLRHETSLKNVDQKIEMKSKEMIKLIRKIETEELIHVSQIAKRGAKNG